MQNSAIDNLPTIGSLLPASAASVAKHVSAPSDEFNTLLTRAGQPQQSPETSRRDSNSIEPESAKPPVAREDGAQPSRRADHREKVAKGTDDQEPPPSESDPPIQTKQTRASNKQNGRTNQTNETHQTKPADESDETDLAEDSEAESNTLHDETANCCNIATVLPTDEFPSESVSAQPLESVLTTAEVQILSQESVTIDQPPVTIEQIPTAAAEPNEILLSQTDTHEGNPGASLKTDEPQTTERSELTETQVDVALVVATQTSAASTSSEILATQRVEVVSEQTVSGEDLAPPDQHTEAESTETHQGHSDEPAPTFSELHSTQITVNELAQSSTTDTAQTSSPTSKTKLEDSETRNDAPQTAESNKPGPMANIKSSQHNDVAANSPAQLRSEGGTNSRSTAPLAATSSSSNAVDAARFVQRVARAFRAADEQGSQIRLRLSPPELGALKVEVAVRNGVMSARLEAETTHARSLLLEHLPALRERLAEQQIKIERFDVDLKQDGNRGGSPNPSPDYGEYRNAGRTSTSVRKSTVSQGRETITTSVAIAAQGGDGQINVII